MKRSNAADMLLGTPAIAKFLNLKPRQVNHLRETAGLTTFNLGRSVCARPNRLRAWLEERERSASGEGSPTP